MGGENDSENGLKRRVAYAAFNPRDYLADVEGWFDTEEEAIEHLRVMWNIMFSFAEMGSGIDNTLAPSQQLKERQSKP